MKKKILIIIFNLVTLFSLTAQVGGNQVYQNKTQNYSRSGIATNSIYSTDSTLIVTSKVLLNKPADFYTITIGVNSIAKTVVKANQVTNTKIENVIEKIKKIGINKRNIYVDFIAETKMYDHSVTDREINEYFDGFSIKKNLIIKTPDLSDISQIIDYCSEEEIYDIIKVDYINENLEKINTQMFNEALKISKAKTKRFVDNSSIILTDNYRIVSESFKIYYPKNLYKQYNEAFETSLVNNYYNSNFTRKKIRKEKTYYYDGIEGELGVDKIIDKISPGIGIQYVFELVVTYDLKEQQ